MVSNAVHARSQDNAKNYQLWNHRRKCALRAGPSSAEAELDFTMLALEIDEKNYHAWAHRLVIVQVSTDYSEWHRHQQHQQLRGTLTTMVQQKF